MNTDAVFHIPVTILQATWVLVWDWEFLAAFENSDAFCDNFYFMLSDRVGQDVREKKYILDCVTPDFNYLTVRLRDLISSQGFFISDSSSPSSYRL